MLVRRLLLVCVMFFVLNYATSRKQRPIGHRRFPFRIIGHISVKYQVTRIINLLPPEKIEAKCNPVLYPFKNDTLCAELHETAPTVSDADKMAGLTTVGVDNVTLYEYTFSTLSADEEDIHFKMHPATLFLKTLRDHLSTTYQKHVLTQYLTAAEYDKNKTNVCMNSRGHTLTGIDGTRGCVFFQTDDINFADYKLDPNVTKMMPTSMADIINIIKPFRDAANFNDVFHFIFKPSSIRTNDTAQLDVCTVSITRVPPHVKRLVACVSNDTTMFSSIQDGQYFCPKTFFPYHYEQMRSVFNKGFKLDVLPFKDVRFQQHCKSKVDVHLKPDTDIEVILEITSTFDGIQDKDVNNNQTNVEEIIGKAVNGTCPFHTFPSQVYGEPQVYHFELNVNSFVHFYVFVNGTTDVVRKEVFLPCYFQQKHISSAVCEIYAPLAEGVTPKNTGGLLEGTYRVLTIEKDYSKLILVEGRPNCENKRVQTEHVAFLKQCFQHWCDNPAYVNENFVESNLKLKLCAVGNTGHTGGLSTNTDYYTLACYFKISINNDKAVYEFGALRLESFKDPSINFKNVTFFDCATAENKIKCETGKNVILCCCKAGFEDDNTQPCNNRDTALNKLATSQLRASVKCNSKNRLKKRDSARCRKPSSTPRICVSIFDVVKERKEISTGLTRETCDLEVLHETDDLPLTFCHYHRHAVLKTNNNTSTAKNSQKNCYSFYFHDPHNVIPDEAEDRVISCCSPEYYEAEREAIEKKKFKTLGDLIG